MNSIAKSLPLVLLGTLALVGCSGPLESDDVFEDEAQEEMLEESAIGEAAATEDENDSFAINSSGDPADLVAWCNDILSWNASWTSNEDQVLTLVNQKRAAGATCGATKYGPAAAVTFDERLRCAARKHSKDMVVNNFFSHTGSNGSTPWQRINNAGYVYTAAAENIAAGYSTAQQTVDQWMASEGHCKNIMNPNLKQLGTGYYPGGAYGHYWTQSFGKP